MARNNFIALLRDIASEESLGIELFSANWIIKFTGKRRSTFVHGYNFDLNSSAAQQICSDKNATYHVLRSFGIACIPHELFMNPNEPLVSGYIPKGGSMIALLEYCRQFDYQVVVKPLKGTGGNSVFKATSPRDIECAIFEVWKKDYGAVVSPFLDIKDEIRVVVLLGKSHVIYKKKRQCVTGDGKRSLKDLLWGSMSKCSDPRPIAKFLSELSTKELMVIPAANAEIPIEWRHNLGLGAKAERVFNWEAVELALQAAKAVNRKFCSVDIVELPDGSLAVLEINSGVMMDSFIASSDENRLTAKEIYRLAILESLV